MAFLHRVLVSSCLVWVAACSSDSKDKSGATVGTGDGGPSGTGGTSGAGGSGGGGTDTACPVVVKDADCDKSLRPFVFVHGTYGSGDNFAHVAALLASNGYCADRIIGVEYNSLGESPGANCTGDNTPSGCGKIDKAVDAILAATGADKVDIAGHSQGTAHCGTYLGDATHAAKVAHYVNFSGSPNVGDVDTLSLSSQHDLNNTPHHAVGNKVKQVTFTDQDHFAVAASTDSFVEVYKYLNGDKEPKYKTVQCGEDPVTISGLAESFADNVPQLGKIELREVSDTPRAAPAPVQTIESPDATGAFGPIQLKRNVPYEIKGFDQNGTLIGYQYFTPFKRSNRLVRLLVPSANTLIAGASTDLQVRGPNHTAIVFRWAGGAFRQDLGASLKINGNEILTSDNAGAGALATPALAGGVVGLFIADQNGNKQSDLGLDKSGPFIAFTDVYVQTDTPELLKIEFSPGSEDPDAKVETVKMSNWPSDQAQNLVMFQ